MNEPTYIETVIRICFFFKKNTHLRCSHVIYFIVDTLNKIVESLLVMRKMVF